jgi:hypothetical protein
MRTSIDAAREALKPTESSRLAKAAALVAATTLATLAGAAIAAGQPRGQMASDLATRRYPPDACISQPARQPITSFPCSRLPGALVRHSFDTSRLGRSSNALHD